MWRNVHGFMHKFMHFLTVIEGIDNAWCLLSTPRGLLRPHPRRYLEILIGELIQNIYFHFHLFTVQCMSSVYHAV